MRKIAKQTGHPCVDFTTGESTWGWPSMPPCKQQMVRSELFDPYKEFSKRGAHMPLMVFIGDKGKQRRTHEGRARRDVKADGRGWHVENDPPGTLMERKEREPSNDTPGGNRSQGQVIQTLGGPPQARIGTHGNGATHFIGCRCRPKHALAWNSRWWGELTVVRRIIE